MNMLTTLRRGLDSLSIYLPVLLLALLALGSWWLERSLPDLMSPQNDAQLRQDPDYKLTQFTMKSFDASGRLTREIGGQSAVHFPATKALHIESVRIFFENDAGTRLSVQAQQGVSLDAEQTVTFTGDVQAVRAADALGPRTSLQGQALTALLDEERLVSSLPVKITRDADVFTAQSMDFDTRSGQYELQGQVKSILAPVKRQP
jgi:lipopolysaccharide export system protein LptC